MYKTIYLIRDVRIEHIRKIPLSMRLTIVILLIPLFQLSAKGTFGQKVSFRKNNTTLEEVFRVIKIQTGYNVVWSNRRLDGAEPVDVNFRKATVEKVMDEVLKGRAVAYEIIDNAIVIKEGDYPFKKNIEKIISYFTNIDVRGRVVDENNVPLIGALIKVKGAKTTVITDKNGEFLLKNIDDKAVLTISFLGFEPQELKAEKELGNIKMIISNSKLEEVEVVSTGYQELPKERATGSFTFIDNKTISRAVGTNILDRLKGVTNGLLTDPNVGNSTGISIRGRSTIFSNTTPLIILDNFPFDGDINTINPEMVESVTVLKDAAAASIWGSLSGNGVIVITTKKGVLNQMPSVNIKADLTIGAKPNLYYEPQLTSSEYIDIEQFLFEKGKFTANFNNDYSYVSPVVAILQKIKLDPAYATQGRAEIDALRNIDYRDQWDKYFFRNSTQQRYFASIRGGGNAQTYNFSAGYDKSLPNSVTTSNNRLTLKGNNTYYLLKERLQFDTDLTFSKSQNNSILADFNPKEPYQRLADDQGNPLSVPIELRESYTDVAGNGLLLSWKNKPLDELREAYSYNNSSLTDYRVNLGLSYKIIKSLKVSVNYQYYNASNKNERLQGGDSFYTRNMINSLSQINTQTGNVTRPVPLGDIYAQTFGSQKAYAARGQLSFNQTYREKHLLSAIAGYEFRETVNNRNSYTVYGYKPAVATSIDVDFISLFTNFYTGNTSRINSGQSQSGSLDRYVSWYGNGSYSYDNKYIISASYRKDASNLFGVKANQKGVPLWSIGISWNIYKDFLADTDWLSALQLRTTYGYNGNVNKSTSAYLTARANSAQTNFFTNTIPYQIINPPNDNLRWERVKNLNFALTFSVLKNRVFGSIEYYIKNGLDIIGDSPIAPQVGILSFTGNTANTRTKGIDIQLNSKNINGLFSWNSVYILNVTKDKITNYQARTTTNGSIVTATSLTPLKGYPINSLFAYPWAGLNALGNPLGYLNGNISTEYINIRDLADPDQLAFFGSRSPTIFGSFRNTFSYKNLELSFNITYKLGYYYFRRSLLSSNLYGGAFRTPDYHNRWKIPGDELLTNVPALLYPSNASRDGFYQNSAALVEKRDQILLQDIQFNYNLTKKQFNKLPFSNINIYFFTNNLGLLWVANKQKLDPNVSNYPTPRTFALGMSTTF
jgi:TonB-linked SusC/RagA family outer membrane protein